MLKMREEKGGTRGSLRQAVIQTRQPDDKTARQTDRQVRRQAAQENERERVRERERERQEE